MVIPILPIAGASLLGGGLAGWFLGTQTKKDGAKLETQAQQEASVYIAPKAFYAPTTTEAWQYSYQPVIQIESPYAQALPVTKKEDTISQTPQVSPQVMAIPQVIPQATTQTSATAEFMPLAIIAVAGLILYGAVSK
jgi:hypothetical protein